GGHERQRAGGRHAQVMHGFTAQELADRGAQHRAAFSPAGIRRRPAAFDLKSFPPPSAATAPPRPIAPPAPNLPGPWPNLVAAVVRGPGVHALEQPVAAEDPGERRRGNVVRVDTQLSGHLGRMRDQPRRRNRRRRDPRPRRTLYLAHARPGERIAREFAQEGVVEAQLHARSVAGGARRLRALQRLHPSRRRRWPVRMAYAGAFRPLAWTSSCTSQPYLRAIATRVSPRATRC